MPDPKPADPHLSGPPQLLDRLDFMPVFSRGVAKDMVKHSAVMFLFSYHFFPGLELIFI